MRKNLLYLGLIILWVLCLMVAEGEAGVVVPEKKVHRAVSEYVRELLADFEGEIEVFVRRRGDLQIEGTGAVRLEVRSTGRRTDGRIIPAVLEVYRGPVMVDEYLLSASVRYFDDVVVAARPIERSEAMTEDAVAFERQDVTGRRGRYLRDTAALEGTRTKTRIAPGRRIDPRFIERIPAVVRREQVRIRVQSGTLMMSTSGIAMATGAVGDRITVKNSASGEKLVAEVVGPGVVQVLF